MKGRSIIIITGMLILTLLCVTDYLSADGEKDKAAEGRAKMLEEVTKTLAAKDSFALIDLVEGGREDMEALKTYFSLVGDLHYNKKNVNGSITVGRLGIHFALSKSLETEDAELKKKYRNAAMMMASNIAANTWPGWMEEGIELKEHHLGTGMDAARACLRLAEELKVEPQPMAQAVWNLGAHQLSAGDTDSAIDTFGRCRKIYKKAGMPDYDLMCLGYVGICNLAGSGTKEKGGKEFSEAVEGLNEIGSDDAKFFISQLETAKKFFIK